MTQHIFPRDDEQAKTLRNAAALPYHDQLDSEIVSSALEEEKLKSRVRRHTL
jgi:hypothetical protein